MRTYWKIIFIIADIITFGLGAPTIVQGLLSFIKVNNDYQNIGIGVFMITIGILIHFWKKHYFVFSKKEY